MTRVQLILATVLVCGVGLLAPTSPSAQAERPPQTVSAKAVAKKPTIRIAGARDVSTSARARLRIVVRAPGKRVLPKGLVRVSVDGRKAVVTRFAHGKRKRSAVVTLPKLGAGQHRVRAAYRSKGRAIASTSAMLTAHRGCAWRPSACGLPDSSNTGVSPGVRLRSVPGQVTRGRGWHWDSRGYISVDGDGAVLSNISTTDTIDVTADNVTIKNVRITTGGEGFGIALRHTTNVTIDHVDLTAPERDGPRRLMVGIKDIYADGVGTVIRRSDISRTSTAIQMDAGTIEDNYIHDLGYTSGDHVNGITSNAGSRQLTIRRNTVLNHRSQTDAISLFQDFGRQANRLIEGNLLAGGGYTLYAGANSGKQAGATHIVIRNNRFAKLYFPRSGYWGPATAYANNHGNQWVGNVWDQTGQTIRRP